MKTDPVISVRHLRKYYGKNRGIEDVSFEVKQGEIFGFIGPNGAGKSTTIRTILGFISPSGGDAFILGKEIQKDRAKILSDIGYMPSEAMFYTGMRVWDIISLSAKLQGMKDREESKKLCERFGLDVKKRIEELSLGNRKKVSIVCAFQHMPKVLILDEPTSGLDPVMQKAFFDLIEERNQSGATILLSSHVLSEIQKHCTRAAIIRDGQIIACNEIGNLTKTNVKRVWLDGISENSSRSIQSIQGVSKLNYLDGTVNFLYQGQIQDLLNIISGFSVNDLQITEPELEEIFLHYYEGGNPK